MMTWKVYFLQVLAYATERFNEIKNAQIFQNYKQRIVDDVDVKGSREFFVTYLDEERAKELIDQCFDGFAQIIAGDDYANTYLKLESQEVVHFFIIFNKYFS